MITIAATQARLREGEQDAVPFVLTRSVAGNWRQAVAVTVTRVERGTTATEIATVTFERNQAEATLSVAHARNFTDEADREVTAEIRAGAGYEVGAAARQTVIVEDVDPGPAFSIEDAEMSERDGSIAFTVVRTFLEIPGVTSDPDRFSSARAAIVDYATADGTATAGVDYDAASGSLTFAPGGPATVSRSIRVRLREDATVESAETFTVGLSNARHATIADAAATGTILDDARPVVSVRAGAASVAEGEAVSFTAAADGEHRRSADGAGG